jgi:cephalosporin hydroxylase
MATDWKHLPVVKRLVPSLRKRVPRWLGARVVKPNEYPFSALPPALLASIQIGTMRYSYRGVPMLKNPFDIALYMMLLWQTKPRTIIEIGSRHGGSAMWLHDVAITFGLECKIHSVDVVPVTDLRIDDVAFHHGDGRDLGRTFDRAFLDRIERPLLVIEDADHSAETTLAVLRFFDPWIRPGEYMVVEDGIITTIERDSANSIGPHAGIRQFLAEHGDKYEMDRDYCDWFGVNVTWNVNGFLRRK